MNLILKTINLLHSYIQVRPCHLDIGIALCTGDDKIWILNPHFSQTVSSLWTTHPRSFVSDADQNLVVDMRVVKAIWTGLPNVNICCLKRKPCDLYLKDWSSLESTKIIIKRTKLVTFHKSFCLTCNVSYVSIAHASSITYLTISQHLKPPYLSD